MATTVQLGEVVTFSPACNCPPEWRPLARELEGQTFQIVGTADLMGRSAVVLQPWPCFEPFPSYQLAPADCVRLGSYLIQREPSAEVA